MADLLATCWTTAGNAYPLPGKDASPLALEERVAQAAKAGFKGFGLMHVDLERYLETGNVLDLKRLFADHGIRSIELEFLTGWWSGAGDARVEQVKDLLLRASEVLEPHHVKIGPDLHGTELELDQWATALRSVSAQFADAGTVVAIEFMPFSNIQTLDQARSLVVACGHPAAGIMIDSWHVERGATTYEEVAALSPDLIHGVEIDDGWLTPVDDGYTDTINRRELCGEGEFDLPAFVTAVNSTGWSGPWGVEILSATYRTRALEEALPESFTTAQAIVDSYARDNE